MPKCQLQIYPWSSTETVFIPSNLMRNSHVPRGPHDLCRWSMSVALISYLLGCKENISGRAGPEGCVWQRLTTTRLAKGEKNAGGARCMHDQNSLPLFQDEQGQPLVASRPGRAAASQQRHSTGSHHLPGRRRFPSTCPGPMRGEEEEEGKMLKSSFWHQCFPSTETLIIG